PSRNPQAQQDNVQPRRLPPTQDARRQPPQAGAQQAAQQGNPPRQDQPRRLRADAVEEAQIAHPVEKKRPEQELSEHDRSDRFAATKAKAVSPALESQPKEGKVSGFDFYRDPLNSDVPMQSPKEIMEKEIAAKEKVM